MSELVVPSKEALFNFFYVNSENSFGILNDFINSTNQKNITANHLLPFLSSFHEITQNNTINMLDLGCGEGTLSKFILKELSRRFSSIDAFLIDPSRMLLEKCKENILSEPILNRCKITYINNGLYKDQDFQKTVANRQFDFILCSYIFFWIENWKWAIEMLFNILRPFGAICIVTLSRKTDPEAFDFRNELFEIAHNGDGFKLEASENIEKIVHEFKGIVIAETSSFISYVNLPWDNKEYLLSPYNEIVGLSRKTINILQFLLRKPWEEINIKSKKEIISLLNKKFKNRMVKLKIPEKVLILKKK